MKPLTYEDIKAVANKQGWIHWPRSGTYEQLSKGHNHIMAKGFRCSKRGPEAVIMHPLFKGNDRKFYCIALDSNPNITVGALFSNPVIPGFQFENGDCEDDPKPQPTICICPMTIHGITHTDDCPERSQ